METSSSSSSMSPLRRRSRLAEGKRGWGRGETPAAYVQHSGPTHLNQVFSGRPRFGCLPHAAAAPRQLICVACASMYGFYKVGTVASMHAFRCRSTCHTSCRLAPARRVRRSSCQSDRKWSHKSPCCCLRSLLIFAQEQHCEGSTG